MKKEYNSWLITESQAYATHSKVKQAHQLLIDAWREVRAIDKRKSDSAMCECGHTRFHHGPPHSVNYTGGACEKCDCLNFLKDYSPKAS